MQGRDGVRRTQKCPFDAIMIINLPKNLEKETTHRYGPNSFKLHRRGTLLQPTSHEPAYLHLSSLTCAALLAGYQCPGQRRCWAWLAPTVRS